MYLGANEGLDECQVAEQVQQAPMPTSPRPQAHHHYLVITKPNHAAA